MNLFEETLREIKYVIPDALLVQGFSFETYQNLRRPSVVGMDEMIRSKVLRSRLLRDCNLMGGREVAISLEDLPEQMESNYRILLQIPNNRTDNREILSVLSVSYLPVSSISESLGSALVTDHQAGGAGEVASLGNRMLNSFTSTPKVSTASVELIGYNTICIYDPVRPHGFKTLICVLSYDESLNNFSPRSYPTFFAAAILVTKAFLYRTLTIRVDQGFLEQGQALGQFKTILDSYATAEEEYQVFRSTKLREVLAFNSPEAVRRVIGAQMFPNL